MTYKDYIPEKHGILLKSWWESRQELDFPLDILPKTGLMAFTGKRAVAALFLWSTDSTICVITAPIADPESSKEERDIALQNLYAKLHKRAEDMGHQMVWTTAEIPRVKSRLEELGYEKGSDNVTHYIKRLQ